MLQPRFKAIERYVSLKTLEKNLNAGNYSVQVKNIFLKILKTLPALSVATYFQYGQMLHYTITGDKIPINRFHFQSAASATTSKDSIPFVPPSSGDSHATWEAELELMRMVEDGNKDYEQVLSKIAITGSSGHFNLGDPLRQAKDYGLTFIVLASRAAMRGGLPPELSYTLSDFYIQSVETARTLPEIQEIGHSMYEDYISRVHDLRKNSHISRQIHESCNYIQIHSTEKLDIADIAAHVGYAEYYFSRKFKKEVGISVKDYIKQTKLERVKIMLKSGTQSIQEISESLHFSSQSYFADIFHQYTGMTPTEYRKKNGESS